MTWAPTIRECLDRRERVDVHWWFDRGELAWRVSKPEPLPPAGRIFMVEATTRNGERTCYVDPSRLLLLPVRRARELGAGEPVDRETFALQDALRCALERPDRFGVDAYGPFPDELPRPRAIPRDLEAEWPGIDDPHVMGRGPSSADYGKAPRDPNDPAYHATLEQLGLEVSNDNGRMRVRSESTTGYWRAKLLELEHGPTYVNGVPVRRWPCTPPRFEVALYELTANTGLGSGGRERITRIMTLDEAARHVLEGRCPHFKCSSAGTWTETQA